MVADLAFETLVQYGGIGIGIAAVWALYRISNGVLKSTAAAMGKVSESMDKLQESAHRDHLEIITLIQSTKKKGGR